MKNKPRLQEKYEKEIASQLEKEFEIENKMAIPRLTKIVVNSGIGEAMKNKNLIETMSSDLAIITGQKPSVRLAKVSIATFNLRRGMPVGLTTTLRGERMYSFLDRLVSIVLPRLRDFKGMSLKSFDKAGNYTLGITEHTVFPEIDLPKTGSARGLEVTIVTNAKGPEKSKRLLELLGMPFSQKSRDQGRKPERKEKSFEDRNLS